MTLITLRKNAERLLLLKSPEERQRRISEVPEIHADPTMNPNYESEEDIRSSDHSKKGTSNNTLRCSLSMKMNMLGQTILHFPELIMSPFLLIKEVTFSCIYINEMLALPQFNMKKFAIHLIQAKKSIL